MLTRLKPYGMLPVRLALSVIFFAHGAQKVFGWFEGMGLSETIQAFHTYLGVPAPLTVAAALTELLGSLLVAAGFLTRWAAMGLALVMTVAIITVHISNGFFLNWYSVPGQGHGIEYNLMILGACLSLAILGPGKLSIDDR